MNGSSTGDSDESGIDFTLLRITRGRMEEILGALWHDVLYVDGIDPIDRQTLKRHVKGLNDLVDDLGRILDSPDDEIDTAEARSLTGLIVARFRQFLRHPAVAETAIATTLLAGGLQVAESQTVNAAVSYVIDQVQAATGETVSGAVIEQAVDDLPIVADDPDGSALDQPGDAGGEPSLGDLVSQLDEGTFNREFADFEERFPEGFPAEGTEGSRRGEAAVPPGLAEAYRDPEVVARRRAVAAGREVIYGDGELDDRRLPQRLLMTTWSGSLNGSEVMASEAKEILKRFALIGGHSRSVEIADVVVSRGAIDLPNSSPHVFSQAAGWQVSLSDLDEIAELASTIDGVVRASFVDLDT